LVVIHLTANEYPPPWMIHFMNKDSWRNLYSLMFHRDTKYAFLHL
jgi:hypothetical protein